METENENEIPQQATGRGTDGRFDALIEELHERLLHTREFLEKIRESDPDARLYVEELAESLNSDLKRLRRKA